MPAGPSFLDSPEQLTAMDVGIGSDIYTCIMDAVATGEKPVPVFYLTALEKYLGGGLGTKLVVATMEDCNR